MNRPYSVIIWIFVCGACRVVLSASSQRGVMATKLNVPADWKGISFYFLFLVYFLCLCTRMHFTHWFMTFPFSFFASLSFRVADLPDIIMPVLGFSCRVLYNLWEFWFILEFTSRGKPICKTVNNGLLWFFRRWSLVRTCEDFVLLGIALSFVHCLLSSQYYTTSVPLNLFFWIMQLKFMI